MEGNWIEIEIGKVFETVTGNTPPKNDIENYGSEIPFVKPPEVTNKPISDVEEFLSEKGAKKSRLLPRGSVLVTCIGNLGRVGLAKNEVAFNQQINAIKPVRGIDSSFTFYQAQSPQFKHQLEKLSSATTVPIVNKGKFNTISFRISPLPEQRAIVARIEELFSELDHAVSNLLSAQAKLEIYRQAVLKKAFEGGFTKGENWEWRHITEISLNKKHSIKAGPFGSSLKKEFYTASGFKVYGQEQVISGDPFFGDYYIGKTKYEELKTCAVQPGDILISLVGTVGKVLILPENALPGIINPRLIKITLDDHVYNRRFFKYYFESSKVKSLYKMDASGTTMDVLNLGVIKRIPFPLPPTIQEQTQIVQEIESRLSVADKLAETIQINLQKSEALRQSILKKAFEGRLLSEAELEACRKEADWEPAERLLARIEGSRDERIKIEKKKK